MKDADPRLPTPLVTADIVAGAITNRVARVRRTRAGVAAARAREVAAQRQDADAIAATRRKPGRAGAPVPAPELPALPPPPRPSTRRKPAAERRPIRTKGMPPGWVVLCVSAPGELITELDAAIARLNAGAGGGRMSRSRLIRIAVAHLDVDRVIAELRRLR